MNMRLKVGHYYLIPYPILKNQLYSSEQKMAVAICVKKHAYTSSPYWVFQLLQQAGWNDYSKGLKNCWNAHENQVKEIPKEQVVLYLLKEE